MTAEVSVKSSGSALDVSPLLKATLFACWATTILSGAVRVAAAVSRAPERPPIFDFHAFMLAGRLAWAGRLADAYNPRIMLALEQQAGGHATFMPWSYPPLFGVAMAPFSQMPIALAFGLFVVAAFALFLLAMVRLTPRWAWVVLLTIAPTTVINLATGQNGLLTGGLTALAATAFLQRRAGRTGIAVGALVFKPHMAVVWPVLLVMRRRWAAFLIAGSVVLALTAASFVAVGPEPFRAFFSGGAQTGRYMAAGSYPLMRMTSLYATGVSLGLAPAAALGLHVATAVLVLAGVARAGRGLPEATQMGLALMTTAFLSPYFYDYDQPVFGVGLALVLPELAARTTRLRLGLLLTLVAAAEVVGFALRLGPVHPSLGGPLLLTAMGLMLLVLCAGRRAYSPELTGLRLEPA